MAWIAVDEGGNEFICGGLKGKPTRSPTLPEWVYFGDDWFYVPNGTAEKLTGKPMTWEDCPRELK